MSVPEPRSLMVDVALVPAFISADPIARRDTTFIVVDVIRATTTLCVLFERGCRRVFVAPGIAEARAYRDITAAPSDRPALAGEIGGVAPAGFDFGNSPAEFSQVDVLGREIVFATTNGTRALHAGVGGRALLAGALRNASAVCAAALASAQREPPESHDTLGASAQLYTTPPGGASEAPLFMREPDIMIICSGRDDHPAYDDVICAGYLARQIIQLATQRGQTAHPCEGARIAMATASEALRSGGVRAALAASAAARAIARCGLDGDLDWCATIDATDVVPAVTGAMHAGPLIVERLPSA